jgi:hypothetical protein
MSEVANKKLMKTAEDVENAKNKAYSRNFPYLIGMVKALYSEFQELLNPKEVVDISSYKNWAVLWRYSKDGIKKSNGHTISVDEYIERAVQSQKNNDLKFQGLQTLISGIRRLERDYGKKLTGKYFKTYMQNEVAKRIFERYGQKIGKTLEEIQSMMPDLYDDLEKKAGMSLTDEEKGEMLLGILDSAEILAKVLIQKVSSNSARSAATS